jgi:hypothetical protein
MKLTLLPLKNDDVVRIRCDGHLTRLTDPDLDPLKELLGPHCFSLKVLLNLERAQTIDTSGVSWLLRMVHKFTAAGGKFVALLVPPVIGQVLDFMRLRPLLPVAADEAAALEMLHAGAGATPRPFPGPPRPVESVKNRA